MITSRIFAELQYTSGCWNEDHDCAVKAAAIALNIRYAEAWYLCRKYGREFRKGMDSDRMMDVLSTRKDVIHLIFNGTIIRFMQMHPQGSYVFAIPGHILAYKDGVVHDDVGNWKNKTILQIFHLVDKQQ